MSVQPRCADVSEEAGESLGATATTAEHWLLVEMPGTWSSDVSDGEGLSEPGRRTVRTWLERTPSSRVQFVRRPGRARGAPLLTFVVHGGEAAAEVRRIELTSQDELAGLDLTRAGEVTTTQLVLVCGHGTRDACCALRSTAVYGALAPALDADRLWISSHQGGHRFATNILVLPSGIHLGRVRPDEAARVVARALAGRIELERYRGRTVYERVVQAAERAVREASGLDAVSDLHLLEVDGDRVRFRGPDGREHAAHVEESSGPVIPASCGADATPQTVYRARVV